MQECELSFYYIVLIMVLHFVSIYFNIKYRSVIRKNVENENILIKSAYFNPVTSLPNAENIKIVISEQIDRALRHDKSFLIIWIRIKNYHEVKLHSNVLANEFILEASDRLIQSTRSEDIVGHVNDDTFIVVFNEYLEDENYNILLKRVEEAFSEAPKLDTKYNIEFQIAIGKSKFPDDAKEAAALIERAKHEAIDID